MSAEMPAHARVVERRRMVKDQLRARGVTDNRVLAAMETIERHRFVPAVQSSHAYDDRPLPIGHGQTISQPYMVARMSELLSLDSDSRVLEIGTGSGYQTAVLAAIAAHVWSVERVPPLAAQAKALLLSEGYSNVDIIVGDGTLGYPEAAPYAAILVAAAAPKVPRPLLQQLVDGGRMVIPIESGSHQELLLVEKIHDPASGDPGDKSAPEGSLRVTKDLDCVFVPLIGEEGYSE